MENNNYYMKIIFKDYTVEDATVEEAYALIKKVSRKQAEVATEVKTRRRGSGGRGKSWSDLELNILKGHLNAKTSFLYKILGRTRTKTAIAQAKMRIRNEAKKINDVLA